MIEDFEYLNERLEKQREWHSAKADWNKKRHYVTEVIMLGAVALIPVINVLGVTSQDWSRVLSVSLASVSVVSAGIGKLYKFQENWLSFRALAEALKREKELYLNQVGDYALENNRRQKILVERIENMLASTTTQFVAIHKAEQEKPQAR